MTERVDASLVALLLCEAKGRPGCPHLDRADARTCHCRAVPAVDSVQVCDAASLQLWCLDEQRHRLCLFFPQEPAQQS